jgi:hypothetical protein
VGIGTDRALRRAAAIALGSTDAVAVVIPAGLRDHVVCRAGEPVALVPSGTPLCAAVGSAPVIAIGAHPEALAGCEGPDGRDPLDAGRSALTALGPALLAILDEDLSAGVTADVAALVPAYVVRPRGLAATGAQAWSPELR